MADLEPGDLGVSSMSCSLKNDHQLHLEEVNSSGTLCTGQMSSSILPLPGCCFANCFCRSLSLELLDVQESHSFLHLAISAR